MKFQCSQCGDVVTSRHNIGGDYHGVVPSAHCDGSGTLVRVPARGIMGHANLENLSLVFLRQLYAKGKVSIREAADFAVARGETLHAGEGYLDDPCMIAYGMEEIASFWVRPHKLNPKAGRHSPQFPIVEAVNLTPSQRRIFDIWCEELNTHEWGAGKNGRSGEHGVLDSIKWKLTTPWRKLYPNIPLLGYFEN